VTATLLSLVIGTLAGVWAGYFAASQGPAKWGSEAVMRGFDILQAFPVFVLALALVTVLGRSEHNVIGVLAVLGIPLFARLSRAAVLRTREEQFVDAARCTGNSEFRLMWRHVLPNSLSASLVMASAVAGSAILLTAGLSFIGAGIPAPTPELGSMVAIGAPALYTGQWWPALFPGVAIGLTVLCLSAAGDALVALLEPGRGGTK
jgi:peptide/nickel transport system permease protein